MKIVEEQLEFQNDLFVKAMNVKKTRYTLDENEICFKERRLNFDQDSANLERYDRKNYRTKRTKLIELLGALVNKLKQL